ncbi:MAG: undecaprenyldiphospho-muramoylpentapeptide beta-N-acetylglucosaminyltransferase [Treponemataceae bacterium]|nr:undecaprenyldiphospho-muramoylpentapeptide beta-N-acetylglucosaminyltransferase [Treponemataceae bacterium]
MKYIAFTGGGTGGHIYPGLAVADALRPMIGNEYQILWIGSNKGVDKDIVTKSGSAEIFKGISSGKLRRYLSLQNLADLFKIIGGFFSAFCILAKYRPVALFSKGGFVSVPPCYAAKLLGIPVFTHECDVSPGLATRLNSNCADRIFVSFEKTVQYFSEAKQKKVTVTGDPVRPVFYEADAAKGLEYLGFAEKPAKPILLVLGGSLGARQINELVTENLPWLTEHFTVVHQTGKAWAEEHPEQFENTVENYIPLSFIYGEMPHVMAAADVVLSRAGSNFLWECAVTGKPLVLIPLSGSGTRGDQVENAAFFMSQKAALVLGGRDPEGNETPAATAENLQAALEQLLDDSTRRQYAEASHALTEGQKPAEAIARILYDEVSRRS